MSEELKTSPDGGDYRPEEAVRESVRERFHAIAEDLEEGAERRLLRAVGDAVVRLPFEELGAVLGPVLKRSPVDDGEVGRSSLHDRLSRITTEVQAEMLRISPEEVRGAELDELNELVFRHHPPRYFGRLIEVVLQVQLIVLSGRQREMWALVDFCAETLENFEQTPEHYEALAVSHFNAIRATLDDAESILSRLPAWEKDVLKAALTAALVAPLPTAKLLVPALEECQQFTSKKKKNRERIADALRLPWGLLGIDGATLPSFSILASLLALLGARLPQAFAEELANELQAVAQQAAN